MKRMKVMRYVTPLALILIWQCLSFLGLIPRYKLPSPVDILVGFKDLVFVGMPPGHHLHQHLTYSLYRVSLGYVLAVVLAIPLGILMGWSKRFRDIIAPIVEVVRPIPPLAWIPIAILWLGIGVKSAAFIIFMGAFFPILLNTISGVLTINRNLIEVSLTLGAKNRDVLLKVLAPGATPLIFTGMRIGLGIGWMTLVAAEFTGVKQGYGLGYMIMTARDIQRPDQIIAGMLIIGLVGLFIDFLIRIFEASMLKWR
jgi:ABC-type nitrate/sulfonate/bicarbonate transport system permease component